ncbi:DUF2807 domain-containing protein [Fulvivirga sp. 29W222]|uniref:DUF2807 domain-containing protein n=1 Tax=Fulvivirga marina TaxID=2494733 RepID=A0A937FYX8_9BACT|nr:head GIN domain-containing protein [Fulvivirga marina]MBL6448719.1 DUF2807 domain-containing protein [Fulvivirga marina]
MKTLKLTTAVLFMIITLVLSGCYIDLDDDDFCEKGQAGLRTSIRSLPSFIGISNSIHADIHIRRGSFYEAAVQSNHNIVDDILTNVSGEHLYIESRKCLRDHNTTITVTTPDLQSISNFGSGGMHSSDIWVGDNMKLVLSGSGDIEVSADCEDLDITLTGSGNFDLSGYADRLRTVISGSGNINAFALNTNTCNVAISGSGNSFINVDEAITGSITGSGNVYYRGFPATIDVATPGSGRVIERN